MWQRFFRRRGFPLAQSIAMAALMFCPCANGGQGAVSRQAVPGLERALETLHIPYAELLLVKCSGLSLSDQYWVTPCDAPQNWRDVNFYENDFSDDVGRALFGEGVLSAQPDLCSPCNTSDGFLQKRWRIADGKRILLKAGSGIYKQEPYNEIVASALYDALGMPHVPYWLIEQGGQVMSACACFTNDHTELVTAAQFMRLLPQARGVSNWEHFDTCCRTVGIPDARKAVCNMLAADFHLSQHGSPSWQISVSCVIPKRWNGKEQRPSMTAAQAFGR